MNPKTAIHQLQPSTFSPFISSRPRAHAGQAVVARKRNRPLQSFRHWMKLRKHVWWQKACVCFLKQKPMYRSGTGFINASVHIQYLQYNMFKFIYWYFYTSLSLSLSLSPCLFIYIYIRIGVGEPGARHTKTYLINEDFNLMNWFGMILFSWNSLVLKFVVYLEAPGFYGHILEVSTWHVGCLYLLAWIFRLI